VLHEEYALLLLLNAPHLLAKGAFLHYLCITSCNLAKMSTTCFVFKLFTLNPKDLSCVMCAQKKPKDLVCMELLC